METLEERVKGIPLDVSNLTFSECMEYLWMLVANGWNVICFEVIEDKVVVYIKQIWEELV